MSSVSLNGNKYLPENFKKIDLQGKDSETYLKDNKALIKSNFKDEIYVQSKDDLFVAEFNKFPQGDLTKENIKFVDIPDAEIKLIDDELERHIIGEIKIDGVMSEDGQKFIKDNFKINKSDKITIDDINQNLKSLQKKGKDKFLSIDVLPLPIPNSKTGEVKLKLSAIENPKSLIIEGVDSSESEKIKGFFKGNLTKDNIQEGMNKIKEEFKSHPTKMLLPPLNWDIDNKGVLKINLRTIDLPSKANVNISGLDEGGNFGVQNVSTEEEELINSSFNQTLNPENVEKGIKNLESFYSNKGFMLVNTNIGLNKNGELDLSLTKVKVPKQILVTGMEVFDADNIKNKFKMPLTSESIDKGTDDVKKMYKDAGYVLIGKNGGVDVDTNGDELRVKINLAKVGDIEVFGNARTKERTIKRELGNINNPNQPLNLKELEKGIERVKKTGLFKDAYYELNVQDNGKVKVNIVTKEQKNNEFAVFGAYSPTDGLIGGGSVNFNNLDGEGKSLSIQGEGGTKRLGASMNYSDPWLTESKKVALNASLYAYKWEGTETSEFRVGNTTSLNIPLGENSLDSKWSLNPSLRAEYIGIDKEFSASKTGKDFLVMPKAGINFSDNDNNISPTSGSRFGASLGVATGTSTFIQADASYKKYIPLSENKKFILSLGASGGIQAGNVPYYEKYNSSNSSQVYGRSNDGKERGNSFAVASANLKYNVWGPVSLIAGTTVGGIGNRMGDIGVGGGVEVNLMGIPVSITAGSRYNSSMGGFDKPAININIFKLDF